MWRHRGQAVGEAKAPRRPVRGQARGGAEAPGQAVASTDWPWVRKGHCSKGVALGALRCRQWAPRVGTRVCDRARTRDGGMPRRPASQRAPPWPSKALEVRGCVRPGQTEGSPLPPHTFPPLPQLRCSPATQWRPQNERRTELGRTWRRRTARSRSRQRRMERIHWDPRPSRRVPPRRAARRSMGLRKKIKRFVRRRAVAQGARAQGRR